MANAPPGRRLVVNISLSQRKLPRLGRLRLGSVSDDDTWKTTHRNCAARVLAILSSDRIANARGRGFLGLWPGTNLPGAPFAGRLHYS